MHASWPAYLLSFFSFPSGITACLFCYFPYLTIPYRLHTVFYGKVTTICNLERAWGISRGLFYGTSVHVHCLPPWTTLVHSMSDKWRESPRNLDVLVDNFMYSNMEWFLLALGDIVKGLDS